MDSYISVIHDFLSFYPQYSLENEAERQKLELEAEAVRTRIQTRLGGECLQRRQQLIEHLAKVDAEIEKKSCLEEDSHHEDMLLMNHQRPQANLEHLYH